MNDKQKVFLKTVVFGIVALSVLVWLVFSVLNGASALLPGLILVVIVAFGAKFLKDKHESMTRGTPSEDERTENIKIKAGYYSFLATIWVMLGMMWYSGTGVEELGFPEILVRHMFALSILASAVIFGLAYVYLNSRGGSG